VRRFQSGPSGYVAVHKVTGFWRTTRAQAYRCKHRGGYPEFALGQRPCRLQAHRVSRYELASRWVAAAL